MKEFLVTGGSVPGTEHTRPGQPSWTNNHDAYQIRRIGEDVLIGVVCDGCGSAPHSEVGAKIGAEMIVREFEAVHGDVSKESFANILISISFKVTSSLNAIAHHMSDRPAAVLVNYFLFTIMGFMVTREHTYVFSCGDGVYAVNGVVTVIPEYARNAPPYLTYACETLAMHEYTTCIELRECIPTNELRSLLIGSDGCKDLIVAEKNTVPGRDEPVGSILQFIDSGTYSVNPDAVRRRLALMNREHVIDGMIRKGLLPDDTTLIALRRKEGE
jgi:hypothetical protein